ncbi:hypothetical protein WKI68_35875 [Streptomyces sp. MS1.HAVA.3]|uniref:Uncharacterized protein n=1 Tax=Streptomyces caledonius TaxID=3134107 RepID=A0ABU8UBB2_9ACTN
MADAVSFSFSDTIAGYVVRFDSGTRVLRLKTSDGREFDVSLAGDPSAELVRNLDEPYIDASGHIDEMLSRAGSSSSTESTTRSGAGVSTPSAWCSWAAAPRTTASRSPAGGSSRSSRWPTSTSGRSSATGRWTSPSTAPRSGSAVTRPPATSRRPTRSPAWSTAWPRPTC